MKMVWQGLAQAFMMLIKLDPQVTEVIALTFRVCGLATAISVLLGVPIGLYLALKVFPGRKFVVSLVNTGMGLPPVVVGLWVSILLWRSGPLGRLGLIYTPTSMIIAQSVIATPMVIGLTMAAIQQLPVKLESQILALGASRRQLLWTLIVEARLGILAAVIAGFGAVISEVGSANMVGGNILHQTRLLTTATMMEVSRGNFDVAIALGSILMALAFGVTGILTILQQQKRAQSVGGKSFKLFRS